MPQSEKGLCGKPGFSLNELMLISIVLSIIVLPGIIFFIVCLLGFHKNLESENSIRSQIERRESNKPADDSQPLWASNGGRRIA